MNIFEKAKMRRARCTTPCTERRDGRISRRRLTRMPTFFAPEPVVYESDRWASLHCYWRREMVA